jgi:hypothetical protein
LNYPFYFVNKSKAPNNQERRKQISRLVTVVFHLQATTEATILSSRAVAHGIVSVGDGRGVFQTVGAISRLRFPTLGVASLLEPRRIVGEPGTTAMDLTAIMAASVGLRAHRTIVSVL